MEQRWLGRTGLAVSRLALGTLPEEVRAALDEVSAAR
jgi:aryl-alcohol dehydrogenase-like predicted oxidoreductase